MSELTEKSSFYIEGELPDIGKFKGSDERRHFHGEYTPFFLPDDGYGLIIPYTGNYKIYHTVNDAWYTEKMADMPNRGIVSTASVITLLQEER